ncbi:MBL fold metallo-hydrolase [Actinomadura harenae]|uniref:MBL fold metallo-hydrolase n=1 Tax=Actinomadura harenae TaxID=2483351 RepID=A0A3M2LVT3_9ACTN|nr:MBL fold metallo-hydrolase [Actinomadura harenae]RMI40653.1 MBL fold metallo-hydrolase [Actinomadura harenae]
MSAAITWWGHATATIEVDGVRLLTDPVLTGRIGHLRRRRGPAPDVAARRADAVLISHLHADHLHLPSLALLPDDVPLIVPRGTARFLADAGRADLADRSVETRPGGETALDGVGVRAVPALHSGRRTPWSRYEAPALGYVIEGGRRVWFAGDTDLFPQMDALGPVDAALVPVGGWGPTLGPGHLDPARAAEAVRRVRASLAVPIHYGTFWPIGMERVRPGLFLGPEQAFAIHARIAAPDTTVCILTPGETLP